MAFNTQRRPSSWFGPQFTLQSFSIPSLGSLSSTRPSISSRGSYSAEPRRSSNLKPAIHKHTMPELSMPEPLFQDSYLSSEEDLSPSTPDPKLSCLWAQRYTHDYLDPDETLQDFGLAIPDDEYNIVATYVSIVNVGKPKVVDIPPPSREQSPRPQKKAVNRPPIVWRMPSYDSEKRTSDVGYALSDRAESFDSRTTDLSSFSFSEGPKTPSSFSESLKVFEHSFVDPSCFPEFSGRSSLSRSSTQLIRRHSRNLSASFSKAFLNRLKEAETKQPQLHPAPAAERVNYSLPYTATGRPQTPSDELHMPPRPQHLTPLARQAPVLRRKKSMAGVWF